MEAEKENRIEAIGAAEHEALAAEEDARENTSCAAEDDAWEDTGRAEEVGVRKGTSCAAEEDARESTSCAADAGVRKDIGSAEGVREIAGMRESALGAGQWELPVGRQTQRFLLFVLFAALLLWWIPYTTKGIDVRDTASYLTKYRYIFDRGIQVNELYYFLGELAGGILYALAPARKVLVLNLASGILYVASALLLYHLLKKEMPKLAAAACVLVGTFYGIPWVRTLNWNAWTSLLLALGLVLLLGGLSRDSRRMLAASGFVLGINTYFRMPNALFLALIAVIFWKYVLETRSWKGAVKKCLPFFFGAVAAAAAGLLLALLVLGPSKVVHDLAVLFSVGAGANEGNTHSVTTGIYLFLLGMRDGALAWLKYVLPVAVLYLCGEGILGLVGRRRRGQEREGRGVGPWQILWAAGAAVFAVLGAAGDVLTAHELAASGAIFAGTFGALWYGLRRRELAYSCLCASTVVIMGFLTIGTDTGVNYYRVFLGLPIALLVSLCLRLGQEVQGTGRGAGGLEQEAPGMGQAAGGLEQEAGRGGPALEAAAGRQVLGRLGVFLAACILAFTGAAGLRYALTHVYHDAPNRELTQEIGHPLYEGIYTSEERAQSLDKLMEVLKPYEEEKLLQIGCFNIGCVLTDMEPFYNSSWPDLEYLPMEEFEGQLARAVEEEELPVLLLGTAEESGMNWSPSKYQMIQQLGESSLYRLLYVDPLYTIYVPAR